MPSIQIKNVPNDVHQVYRRRAATAGQSLQEYLWHKLVDEASHPTIDEVLDELDRTVTSHVPVDWVVETIRADRESH